MLTQVFQLAVEELKPLNQLKNWQRPYYFLLNENITNTCRFAYLTKKINKTIKIILCNNKVTTYSNKFVQIYYLKDVICLYQLTELNKINIHNGVYLAELYKK